MEKTFFKEYVKAKKIAKKSVAQAQQEERKSLENKISSEEGQDSKTVD